MFAFNLLRVDFAHAVTGSRQMALIDSRSIRGEPNNAKGLEHGVQLLKDSIRAGPQNIRQDYAGEVINRVPQPALVRFTAHKTPHLIHFGPLHAPYLYRDRRGTAAFDHGLVDVLQGWGLFFNSAITVVGLSCRTRAISRTPLPLSVISTI